MDANGVEKKAWEISRGKWSWEHCLVRDARRNEERKIGMLAFRVSHPKQHPTPKKAAELPPPEEAPLWLVVARSDRSGQEPWYLLTGEPVETAEDAWKVVMAYARRWQIEMTFRYNKSELAMESPRLWSWERRMKLLMMATLAYAFLLSLLDGVLELLREWLLRNFCHRTGKRGRETPAPLYRLRAALSRLWLAFPASYNPLLAGNSDEACLGFGIIGSDRKVRKLAHKVGHKGASAGRLCAFVAANLLRRGHESFGREILVSNLSMLDGG